MYKNWVRIWLIVGVVLVFGQVVIGGITRLTDSGLSITEWNVIKGTLPPLSAQQWDIAFEKYKTHAKTQFEAIHSNMSLSEFKWIYFWEYFHRLWARGMGFIFLFPFLFFLARKQLSKTLIRRLGVVILMAATAAVFGWIMVKSGLNTPDRAWVSAYKLMIHLGIGFSLFGYLLWTTFHEHELTKSVLHNSMLRKLAISFTVLIFIQILFGGLMSGMKAGLSYPTFPDMNGMFIPNEVLDGSNWTSENFLLYSRNSFAPALVQVLHRFTAYLLIISFIYMVIQFYKIPRSYLLNRALQLLIGLFILQIILGILTIINCRGSIPVTLGALHQAIGLLLFGSCLFLVVLCKPDNDQKIVGEPVDN